MIGDLMVTRPLISFPVSRDIKLYRPVMFRGSNTIAPIVRETCEEYGVEYKSFESWGDVMGATLKWLGQLSEDDTSGGIKTL